MGSQAEGQLPSLWPPSGKRPGLTCRSPLSTSHLSSSFSALSPWGPGAQRVVVPEMVSGQQDWPLALPRAAREESSVVVGVLPWGAEPL